MSAHRTSTVSLIVAMHVLSRDIRCDDGVANASIAEAGDRLSELHLLLMHCLPLVQAQHDAEHMLDGFGKPKKRDIDGLLAGIKKAVQE